MTIYRPGDKVTVVEIPTDREWPTWLPLGSDHTVERAEIFVGTSDDYLKLEGAPSLWKADQFAHATSSLAEQVRTLTAVDPVNHPAHYRLAPGVEVIDLTEQLDFLRGNAVKYLARAGRKDGADELEDLKKARWYIDRAIAKREKEQQP